MKLLQELVQQYIEPTETDRGAVEMSFIPDVYAKKNRGIGGVNRARKEKITRKSTATGKVYGRKTIYQKPTSQ